MPDTVIELEFGRIPDGSPEINPQIISVQAQPPSLPPGVTPPISQSSPTAVLSLEPERKGSSLGPRDPLVAVDHDMVVPGQFESLTHSSSGPLALPSDRPVPEISRHIGSVSVQRPPSLQIVKPGDFRGWHERRNLGPIIHAVQEQGSRSELRTDRFKQGAALKRSECIASGLIGDQIRTIELIESPPTHQVGRTRHLVVVGNDHGFLLIVVKESVLNGPRVHRKVNSLRIPRGGQIERVGGVRIDDQVACGRSVNGEIPQVKTRYPDRIILLVFEGDGYGNGQDVAGAETLKSKVGPKSPKPSL